MSSSLGIDTTMDGDDLLQRLLAQKAQNDANNKAIDAQIASLSSATPQSSYPRGIQKQHSQRRSHVPRSMSSKGSPSMARHSSQDHIEILQKLSRSISQRSAPPSTGMSRTSSGGYSSQGRSNIPFTSTGQMAPPMYSELTPAMSWPQDQPSSEYTFSQQSLPLQRSASAHKRGLEDIGEDIGEYISRKSGTLAAPIPYTNSNIHRATTNTYYSELPATPTIALTDATTVASEMSRGSSLYDHIIESGVEMLKVDSSVSCFPHTVRDQFSYENSAPSPPKRRSSTEEQSQLLVGAGASHEPLFSQSYQLASSSAMIKSHSSSSNSSSKSSRNVQRLQELNKNAAARSIMPKGGLEENFMSRENSSQSILGQDSEDKVAISSKSNYVRPKHDRVYCRKCEAHPDGFRGDHELRRHDDREHKTRVKKWICVIPSDGKQQLEPEIPLTKCKACQQKKRYGAYYNAGAHLRRAHFAPKPRGRGKAKSTPNLDNESRGGKAGGDYPSMEVLKSWMREVEELAEPNENDDVGAQGEDVEDCSDEEMLDDVCDNTMYSQLGSSISSGPYTPHDFYQQVSPLPSNYDYLPSPNIDHDLIGLQSTPFDMSQQSSYIPSSIFTSPVQNQFPHPVYTSSEQFQTESLYFPTNLPQNVNVNTFWS